MKEQLSRAANSRSGFVIRLFGTLLAFGLLFYLLSQQGWGEIIAAVEQIPVWRFALAMGLMIVSRFAVAGRWHVLLRSAGLRISIRDTLRITFAGLFATNFLPTTVGGDVIRLAGAIRLKFDAAISTASLVVDRLVGMSGMAVMIPFGLPGFLAATRVQSVLPLRQPFFMAAAATSALGKWVGPFWEKGMRILRKLWAALVIWRYQPRALLKSFGFTWVNMLCLFSVIYVLLGGMNDSIPLWLIGGLYSIVYFVTLLPFSINGYGIQEVSMTFIFSAVGGVSMQSGLTVALLFRTMMMIASLPGAAFVPGLIAGSKDTAEPVQ
ncbi:MAG TPA: lysylphosphatidylglycerol synthase transmembrane domain-containing protein [Anaerolineales bacterium]|jgi:uncharacterized membrane protein YbhN (UPF0104 family)|nr:lysylphosphatidylglycerol synthase transmembrane domain-containing protein [Anaerolineales bacterium]